MNTKLVKSDFGGRNNYGIPNLVESSKPLSRKIELVIDSLVAIKKTINVKANNKIKLDYIICVSEEREYALETIKKYLNMENNKRIFELAKARVEAENRYLELTGKDINLYQKLLTLIIGKNKKINKIEEGIYSITELWKYGISGDLPIVCISIKNINDIDVIEELIKAHEYFKSKNFETDLVILNEEREKYDGYVKDGIMNIILNKNIAYLLNKKGGIYILNNIKNDDKRIIQIYSNLILDAQNGNLEIQLNDIEEDIPTINVNEEKEIIENFENEEKQENELEKENLNYFNQYGGFSEDGKEYLICVNKKENLPMPWSNILANEKFGTLITETMGGYSWYKNCRLNRITTWTNNAILDIPSEVVYLKDDETKKAWSLGLNPMPDNNNYYITYGFGYAKYMHANLRNKTGRYCFCSQRR